MLYAAIIRELISPRSWRA